MPEIKFARFGELLKFLPKSKIKAGDGNERGKHPFYTSSATLSKYIDTFDYDSESLIFGSGGNASIHYCNEKFATSTDCFVVNKDSENIDVKYVYYYLKSNMKILENGFKGAGLKHISKKYISEIKIPLLPLSDQQKIAQQLSQIVELISKREKSIKLLDKLITNTFLDMFEKILIDKNPQNVLTFEEMAIIDTKMTTDFEKYASWPHIGIANIEKDTGKILEYSLVKDENLISGKYPFSEKHILYSKIRPNLNKVALPSFEGLLSADAYPILPKDTVNRIFLGYLLRTNFFLNYILGHCDRANIPKVNQKQLSGFSCNIPDKTLQDEFAKIVTQIEQTKTIYQKSLTELNNLFRSIAQEAFKGEFDETKIEYIQREREEINMAIKLDEDSLLEEIKKGDFDASKFVNEHQSYDAIKDMIFKLIEDEKIAQKFDDSKKIILKVK